MRRIKKVLCGSKNLNKSRKLYKGRRKQILLNVQRIFHHGSNICLIKRNMEDLNRKHGSKKAHCCWQRLPKDIYVLIPEAINMILYVAKGTFNVWLNEDLEMRQLTWTIWVS